MRTFNRDEVAAALPHALLTNALERAFAAPFETPVRAHHRLPVEGGPEATLLLMPAWQAGSALGVKVASVFPGNATRGLPSVNASYLLLDPDTGVPLAVMDGAELTLRRTACASALAARYLAREDAATLLMVGTGKLAPHLLAAHAAERPIRRALVWGRRPDAAQAVCDTVYLPDVELSVVEDLAAAVGEADIISCATLSHDPLIAGDWLRPGQHLDLVGAYTPNMREADDAAVAACDVYVDTYAGALAEAGEIIQAIESGALTREGIRGELADLVSGARAGRRDAGAKTLFKSVGCAIEDLAAASQVWTHYAGNDPG